VYLNTHSYYSLKYGTRSPKQLVEDAKAMGVDTLVLTDINNTSAGYAFYKAAKEAGIHPVLGVEYRNEDELLFIGIARNNEGYRQLCKLLTDYSMQKQALPHRAPDLEDCFFVYRLGRHPDQLRDNEYIGVMMHEVNKLYRSPLLEQPKKLLALCPVTFKDRDGYLAHKLLRAIDKNVLITLLEDKSVAHISETFHAHEVLISRYAAYSFLLDNTLNMLSQCSIEFTASHHNNRRAFAGSKTWCS
jgi:DNA polymerase-3 subunit alpha